MSTNPFDEFQPARPADPFDEFQRADGAPPVRAVLQGAVKVNPEQAARAATLGKERGLPTDVVLRNLQDVELQAAVDAADARLQTSPKLAAAMRKRPEIAPMAHDDIGRLTEVEQAVRKYGEWKAWNGPEPTLKNIALGLAKAVPQAGSAIKAGLDAQMVDFLEWVGLVQLDPVTKADRARKLAQATGAADFTRPDFETSTGRAIYGGVESFLRMIPGAAASIATRSPTPMLAAAGVQTEAEAYGKYKTRGATGTEAFVGAVAEGAVEVATEFLPAEFLTKRLGKAGVGEFVSGLLAREIPSEQVATLLQDAIDTAIANPDKTWGEYLAERPQAAYETLVSTLTQSALMGGVHVAARRLAQMGDQEQQANEASDALNDTLKAAGASALRERSPEQFRALMGEMTDGKIYVDGQVLNQLPEDVKAALPQSVQEQIPTAAATGDVVEISTADALTIAPGTPLEEVLVEHARTDPFAMSKADAVEATKLAQSAVMGEAQRIIQQAQDAEARRAEYDAIHKMYVDQLNAAARFRPAVNEAKAHWLASFYTTMAARTGMTAAQFQAAHPVRVLGEPTSGGQQVMDQVKAGEITVEGYHFSKEDRPTITTAAYGTGLQGSGREMFLNAEDQRLRKRSYFYADKGTGIRPESGVGGRAHRVQLTNVYDSNADPLGLKKGGGGQLGFESRVLDAGFSGYLDRLEGTQPGQVIMLGDQTFQAELLGPQSMIETGKRVPAMPRTEPTWQTQASGTPEMMQAKLEALQANPAWRDYEFRVEGRELQARKRAAVFEQRGEQKPGKPVPTTVDAVANVNAAFELANGQQFKTNRDLKLALQERVLEALKAAKIKLDDFNAGAEQYLVRVALMDAEIALETNPNAVGWYNEKVTKALRLVALIHPEIQTDPQAKFAFVWAMAVTSNGLKVDKNFELAEQAYSTFKSTGKMPTDIQAGQAQAAINNGLALFNEMLAKHGFEALQSFMTTKATVKEIQSFSGLEVGGENLTTEVYGSAILGPKIGNGFFSNLYGRFEQLTMDRWLMRTWGRWTGTLIETNPEQVRAKRVQLRALIQGLDKDQKKAFEAIIKRKLTVSDADAVALAIWKASQKPINRARMAAIADATDVAGQARLAAVMGPLKKGQKRVSFGDELRKVGNALTKYNDGQKEAPSGPPERGRIRKVFSQALAKLQEMHPALTMSDLQALLWYPEKRLYDAAKEAGEGDTGYEDDAAPDYANAAAKLAREKGVSEEDIARTIDEVDNELRATDRAAGAGRTAGRENAAGQAAAGRVRDAGGVPGGAGVLEQPADVGGRARADGEVADEQTGNRAGRYSGGSLAPLEGAPNVAGAAGPDPRLVAVAERYAADNGIPLRRQARYAVVDPERAKRIAAAYEAMPHAPNDPAVKEAYENLARQTLAQYMALQEAGYQFYLVDETNDPYAGNPWNAMRDLRANQRMGVFATEAGFGTSEFDPAGNPLLADTGLEWGYGSVDGPKKRVLFNDLFRAVHDAFGHGLEGAGFRAQGEENAWQAHVRLFTGSAVGAITSETRGQNSWLNYGPHGEKNQTAKVEDTVFADQKTGLMPEWTWTEGRVEDEQQVLEQGPRGTFNPATLELVLNPNANLSTFFHETGHFFLEVLADIASQPNAPAQIVEDFNTFLKWAGIKGDENVGGPDAGGVLAQRGRKATTYGGAYLNDDIRRMRNEFTSAFGIGYGDALTKDYEFVNVNSLTLTEKVDEAKVEALMRAIQEEGDFDSKIPPIVIDSDGNVLDGHHRIEAVKRLGGTTIPAFEKYDVDEGPQMVFNQDGPAPQPQPLPRARTPIEVWQAMTLDQKRPYHERWAESVEQYVMEGKAPSVELQPLMRRFAAWLKSVYGSIKRFLESRGQAPAAGGEALNQVPAPEGVLTDENGKPMVLYHGTQRAPDGIDKFVPAKSGAVFFAESPDYASGWASVGVEQQDGAAFPEQAQVVPAYLRAKNIYDANADALGVASYPEADFYKKGVVQKLKRAGYDSAAFGAPGNRVFVVFDPKQIVSAISGEVLGQGDQPQQPQMALNDDIRRVMDRLLATDEQIAQANEVAGLVPDEQADAAAAERLAKRSVADLKWSVRARDQVIAKLKKQAKAIEKEIREQVTVEVDQTPEMRAKRALDALRVDPEHEVLVKQHRERRKAAETAVRDEAKAALLAENPEVKGLIKGQLLAKNKRDIDNKVEAAMIKWDQANPEPQRRFAPTDADAAAIADSFGFESVDAMLQAIDAFGSRREAIDGLTEKRMLEEHGDLIDERAIQEAANEAVHNEARARSLASELRTQAEMLGARQDTGEVNARGAKITVNALVEAAKQFAANVVGKTALRDLQSRAWQHTAAERRASKRWTEATAAGKTADAVKAKQDQMLNHAAAKAAIDAKAEARKILDFFKRVTKGNDETVVEKGRDPDIVNAARAVLAAYGVESPTSKTAAAYLEIVAKNDPDTHASIAPMVDAATENAQPLDALTFDELQVLNEHIQAMWFLAKRSRQMEVDGDLMDIDDAAQELFTRMEEIGIPDRVPGEGMAITKAEERALFLQQGVAFLRRVEQWAEGMDGKYGGPFLRLIFQPIKKAADRYRADRVAYRKKFQALVDNIAPIVDDSVIAAPELGYTFGAPGSSAGTAMNEILHAIAHIGNDSNKRKLLLGREWAAENPDGTLDTSRWDAFIQRLVNEGKLQREHFDFVQGVWDLMEETKPLAQQAHRDAFGRYFNEVTANAFVDPFGVPRRGGYIPAQVDSRMVKDNALKKLAEEENNTMVFAFPQPAKGFTMSRVEGYTRPLMLDLRTLSQHLDKVLLFSHMTVPARDVRKLITNKKVGQPLTRIQPAAVESMLQPWLQRSAQQVVETPVVGAGKWARIPGIIRARAGMALMFANVSNALQQVTGLSAAAVLVKPSHLMRAMAQHVAHPVKAAQAVWAASPYMDDRAKNEVAVMNEQLQDILIRPSIYERAQSWSMRHAYFLQTGVDNALSPIVWTGAYNQALTEGQNHEQAVQFADSVVRRTQGSTLPEDVSRLETGPAYARVFTQFVSYFNMMANTNGTAIKNIANEVGLKKGAGKAFGVVMLGFMIPIWVAEAIAIGMRGGPEDEDDDGYLDDWLAAVFGFGTVKGLLAQIPILGQFGVAAMNRFNDNPLDDRVSMSPAISLLESSVGAPESIYKAIVEDGSAQKAIRDAATLVSVATGIPVYGVVRPIGYLAGVADDRIEPTGPADMVRGLITGTASPESKQR